MDVNFTLVALSILPALVVAGICFYSINIMLKKELMKQKYQLLKANQKEILPIKLQAYERIVLLLDRISISKLLVRVGPVSDDTTAYKNLLIATVDQEFSHNLTQQIYVSNECWQAVEAAKNTVVTQLHSMASTEDISNAAEYRNLGLTKYTTENATQLAQSFIRNEVSQLF